MNESVQRLAVVLHEPGKRRGSFCDDFRQCTAPQMPPMQIRLRKSSGGRATRGAAQVIGSRGSGDHWVSLEMGKVSVFVKTIK